MLQWSFGGGSRCCDGAPTSDGRCSEAPPAASAGCCDGARRVGAGCSETSPPASGAAMELAALVRAAFNHHRRRRVLLWSSPRRCGLH